MGRATSGLLGVAIAAALVAVYPGDADAQQPSPQAVKAYNDGKDAYALGKLDEAKAHMNRAIKFFAKAPGPYRYLALIARDQSRFEDCLSQSVEAIKRTERDSKYWQAVRDVHAECRDKLDRPPFRGQYAGGGAVWVTTNVEGAVVEVNGLRYGATPMDPRAIATGDIEVGVSVRGWLPKTAEAEVIEGIVTDVIFELERDPAFKEDDGRLGPQTEDVKIGWLVVTSEAPGGQVTVDGEPAEVGAQGRIQLEPGDHEVAVDAPKHEPWRRRVKISRGQTTRVTATPMRTSDRKGYRTKGYVALGGAAALGAASLAFGLLMRDEYETAEDIWDIETSRPMNIGDTEMFEPLRTREDMQDHIDKGDTYRIISAVTFGTAVVALGVSVYYFVKERPAGREGYPPPFAVSPIVPGNGDRGVGATVTYTTELGW